MIRKSIVLGLLGTVAVLAAEAVTIRSKNDLRLWQTVFDRTAPLVWTWEGAADAATVTFSNRLTGAVSSRAVGREAAAARGSCPQLTISATDEALVKATVVQTADGVEVSRVAADLAYVPGAAGQPITVRTKEKRDWYRVRSPSLAAHDADWWNVAGPSGYEVLWKAPAGPHRVVRAFEGVGVVDEVVLKFGLPYSLLLLR